MKSHVMVAKPLVIVSQDGQFWGPILNLKHLKQINQNMKTLTA